MDHRSIFITQLSQSSSQKQRQMKQLKRKLRKQCQLLKNVINRFRLSLILHLVFWHQRIRVLVAEGQGLEVDQGVRQVIQNQRDPEAEKGRQVAHDARDHPVVANLNHDQEVEAKEAESVLQVVAEDLAVAARIDVVVVIRNLVKDPSHVIVTTDLAGIDQKAAKDAQPQDPVTAPTVKSELTVKSVKNVITQCHGLVQKVHQSDHHHVKSQSQNHQKDAQVSEN